MDTGLAMAKRTQIELSGENIKALTRIRDKYPNWPMTLTSLANEAIRREAKRLEQSFENVDKETKGKT